MDYAKDYTELADFAVSQAADRRRERLEAELHAAMVAAGIDLADDAQAVAFRREWFASRRAR